MFRESNLQKLLQELQENVKEDVIIVPQTMQPKKEAEVETPDDMEDIEKEDLTKLDITKKKDREDVVKEVPDKDLVIKPQERKAVESLYLCNTCFKTFESKTSKCILCKSENVELISEGYEEREKRDGTGPHKDSAQRSVSNKGRRKQAGEECPVEEEKEEPSEVDWTEEELQQIQIEINRDQDDSFLHDVPTKIVDFVRANQENLDAQPHLYDVLTRLLQDLGMSDTDAVAFTDDGNITAEGTNTLVLTAIERGYYANRESVKKIKEEELTSRVECKGCGEMFDAHGEEQYCSDECEKRDTDEGIEPKDSDSEKVKIKKMSEEAKDPNKDNPVTEAVSTLIGEVPDLSQDDQIILRWALDAGVIDDQFPDTEEISHGLAAAEEAGKIPHARVTDMADIHALYLQQVLLPKAEEAWSARKAAKANEDAEPDKLNVIADGIADKETADALAEEKGGMVIADEENAEKFAVVVKEVKEENRADKKYNDHMDQDAEDKYNPVTNLRSQVIDMFDAGGFSMTGEQRAATGTHFEFTKHDRSEPDASPTLIKVFLEDKSSEDLA